MYIYGGRFFCFQQNDTEQKQNTRLVEMLYLFLKIVIKS